MKIVVLGGGTMGSGIAQLGAIAGDEVAIRDLTRPDLAAARARIEKSLQRLHARDRLEEHVEVVLDRIAFETELDAAALDAEVIIEAVPEVQDVKRRALSEVVELASREALVASNTSQLSITSLGSALGEQAHRFIGMHFFNPPVIMGLVELIRGYHTSSETLSKARLFVEHLGKQAVVCRKDSPGFITTRAYAAFRLECLRMLEEGVATAEDIDTACKLGFNFPMGPFELSDFNGVDTYLLALESLTEAYGERFRPTAGIRNLVAAGRLGRKTGGGFFDYDELGHRIVVEKGDDT